MQVVGEIYTKQKQWADSISVFKNLITLLGGHYPGDGNGTMDGDGHTIVVDLNHLVSMIENCFNSQKNPGAMMTTQNPAIRDENLKVLGETYGLMAEAILMSNKNHLMVLKYVELAIMCLPPNDFAAVKIVLVMAKALIGAGFPGM